MPFRQILLACAMLTASAARADEGLWTFDHLPLQTLATKYRFVPPPGWADHIRAASLRLAQGCSGSFVSGQGLALTNQHCARDCAQALSTPAHDLVADGFVAATAADERRCPDLELDQLTDIDPVTDRIRAATKGLAGAAFTAAERAAIEGIERPCSQDAGARCDVVTLYHGGRYDLYRYRRFEDVRLVFEAEDRAAIFGNPLKADWPFYDFDVGMLRVYDNGKPLDTAATHLSPAATPARAGDLAFISGNPGETDRLKTVAQLEYMRDVMLPMAMADMAELHGMAAETAREGAALAQAIQPVLYIATLMKDRYRKQHEALTMGALMEDKNRAETDLRKRVAANPAMQAAYGAAWDEIARAVRHQRDITGQYLVLEDEAVGPTLFRDAFLLVRHAREMAKPDRARLRHFSDANLPLLRETVLSNAPIDLAVETRSTQWLLTRVQAHTGTSYLVYRALIGDEDEHDIAARLIGATKLADVKVRQALFDGGLAAVNASTDPLIVYVRDKWEPAARDVRRDWDDTVQAVFSRNAALIDRARLAAGGGDLPPDATFTPRLSFGVIGGYALDGRTLPAVTTLGDAFAHDTGADPFRLPETWRKAKARIEPDVPLDLAASVDAVGGNSGSPMVDRDGKLTGLFFAINDAGEANTFANEPELARGVAVAWPAIRTLLRQAYGAGRLVDEIEGR